MSYSPYAPPQHGTTPHHPYAGYGYNFVYQPLGWKTMAVVVSILATVAMQFVTTGLQWGLGNPAAHPDSPNVGLAAVLGLVALLQSGVSLFAMIISLVWMHQAAKNVRAFNLWGLRFTPGWVVGWWFIPFASLWMPFQAMKEVWKASDPDNIGAEPSSWAGPGGRPASGSAWWWRSCRDPTSPC
jgi:lysylphosphatidylglycerol synthetase-like protein (DUF2156 family)